MKNQIKEHMMPVLIVILVVLVGYHKVFSGGTFFLYEDAVVASNYSHGNSLGNGWRPDKGLGISFFFGDVGMWHAWSIFSLLERIAPSREAAFTFSVVCLDILAVVVQYFFLYTILGRQHKLVAMFLAPLAVFSADQAGQHFLRCSIAQLIGLPLYMLLLNSYYQKPAVMYVFWGGLLLWFVAFFGNLMNLTETISFGFVFSILYFIYYEPEFKKFWVRYAVSLFFGILIALFLGAWIFYSLFLEKYLVDYMRVKVFEPPLGVPFWPHFNPQSLVNYLIGFIQAEWLPFTHNLAGIGFRPFLYVSNVAVIFPLIFLFFIFQRSRNFWEFALKWSLLVLTVHFAFQRGGLWPFYAQWSAYLAAKTSTILSLYNLVFSLQVGLIGLFVLRWGQSQMLLTSKIGRGLQIVIAGLLSLIYGGLFIVCVLALFYPDILKNTALVLIDKIYSLNILHYPRDLMETVAVYNIQRFKDVMGWPSLLFYLSSFMIAVAFFRNKWLLKLSKVPNVFIAVLLCLNNLLLSWSIFPLNEKKLFWDQEPQASFSFEPTDRFYFVDTNKSARTLDVFKREWLDVEGQGGREREIGITVEPPALNLSGMLSFHTKRDGEFLFHAFNSDGNLRLRYLRELARGGPMHTSELINMSAVNYYYSNYPIADLPPNLVLYKKAKQLYVYKNLSAWPYFYLAKELEIAPEENDHLTHVVRDTAYVPAQERLSLSTQAGSGKIGLTSFSYGQLMFDYESPVDELLVVADAWHPFWKARSEAQELKVIRANEVFKAVVLPAGKYDFRLFFDPSPYKVGIYISIVSWLFFFTALIWVTKKRIILGF